MRQGEHLAERASPGAYQFVRADADDQENHAQRGQGAPADIGCLFYGLVIGVDRPPRTLPPIDKRGFVLAAMPSSGSF